MSPKISGARKAIFSNETEMVQHEFSNEIFSIFFFRLMRWILLAGALQWKKVSLYINNKSQVIVKIKSKHIGGALSKKKKSESLN